MPFKKQPERPRTVELWVSNPVDGRYKARTLKGAYKTDVNKAVKQLEKFLNTRFVKDSKISIVEVSDDQ